LKSDLGRLRLSSVEQPNPVFERKDKIGRCEFDCAADRSDCLVKVPQLRVSASEVHVDMSIAGIRFDRFTQ
jgi:hypothetical protein